MVLLGLVWVRYWLWVVFIALVGRWNRCNESVGWKEAKKKRVMN